MLRGTKETLLNAMDRSIVPSRTRGRDRRRSALGRGSGRSGIKSATAGASAGGTGTTSGRSSIGISRGFVFESNALIGRSNDGSRVAHADVDAAKRGFARTFRV
jgi:hypothetical protein